MCAGVGGTFSEETLANIYSPHTEQQTETKTWFHTGVVWWTNYPNWGYIQDHGQFMMGGYTTKEKMSLFLSNGFLPYPFQGGLLEFHCILRCNVNEPSFVWMSFRQLQLLSSRRQKPIPWFYTHPRTNPPRSKHVQKNQCMKMLSWKIKQRFRHPSKKQKGRKEDNWMDSGQDEFLNTP